MLLRLHTASDSRDDGVCGFDGHGFINAVQDVAAYEGRETRSPISEKGMRLLIRSPERLREGELS